MSSSASNFPLTPVYDRVTIETGLFDYATLAESIVEAVGVDTDILELCVGTGYLALGVHHLGPQVTGLDLDPEMLAQATRRFVAAEKKPDFVESSAIDFDLGRRFDGVYVHSGHILLNRRDGAIFVNGVTKQELRTSLRAIRRHLNPGGRLLIGIEDWEAPGLTPRHFDAHDGSWYQRTIIEETDLYGARLHVFFDHVTGKIHTELSHRRPKLSESDLSSALAASGFGEVGYGCGRKSDSHFVVVDLA